MPQTYQMKEGELVDEVCQRYYGYTSGAVEQVYLANPNLADLGEIPGVGVVLVLPDLAPPVSTDQIQLWQ